MDRCKEQFEELPILLALCNSTGWLAISANGGWLLMRFQLGSSGPLDVSIV